MRFQKYWWLGFVGLIGLYKLPDAIAAFHGDKGPIEYLHLGWLLWLLYFVPEKSAPSSEK